jgi:hypothetical protein
MTTKRRTLAEAAIDVLQSSAKQGQEPMHSVTPAAGDTLQNKVDLGGATTREPQGNDVGKVTAAHRPQATAPKGPVVGAEGIHHGPEGGAKGTAEGGEEEVEPPMATSGGCAPTKGSEAADTLYSEDMEPTAEEIEAVRQERVNAIRETMRTLSVDEDINAMFAGSELLQSESFRSNAKTIFETAVIARAIMVAEKLEEDIIQASEEAVEEIREEIEGRVDAYLDHMVEQWMGKNEVAIESGLRTEISEEFIDGLRNLFLEHNLDIPEEKVDVVESLTAKVEQLQSQINETLNTNVELTKAINEGKKTNLIASVCEGLTATQTEKFKTLAEGVEFTTEGEYKGKLDVIREQYFSKQVNNRAVTSQVALAEGSSPTPVETKEISGPMANLVAAMSRLPINQK